MLVRKTSRCSRSWMRSAGIPDSASRRVMMIFIVTGCGPTRQRTPSKARGSFVMAQNVELQPRHRLKRPIVICRVSPLSRTYRSEPRTSRDSKMPLEAIPPFADATQTKVTQVVREHVVPGVMQNPVVGDKVHLERVPAGTPDRSPRFQVRWNPGATEPHRMIGDDQFL